MVTSYLCPECSNYIRKESAPLSIHTGLSVTLCGRIIQLDRNESLRRAKVVVAPYPAISREGLTDLELEAVRSAAKLLAARARRVLGSGWVVAEWLG